MLARSLGEVVLVSGAIPGERVLARVERRQQGVWFATTVDVIEASPDRRDPGPDPRCGGMTFAHVAYRRQCELKASIVADALARIGRVSVGDTVPLTPSPVRGYRLRYRVHAGTAQLGFYREGTHEICDAAASGQLAAESVACLQTLARRLPIGLAAGIEAFECMENLANTERVVNLAMRDPRPPAEGLVSCVADTPGITGVSWTAPQPTRAVAAAGRPWVADPVTAFLSPTDGGVPALVDGGSAADVRRHASSFFQANRFLVPVLVQRTAAGLGDGPVVDLYAGVGLFAVCCAAQGHEDVTAIEGDRISARDLEANASPFGPRVRVLRTSVEAFLHREAIAREATLIVDPPRTGMSRAAMQGILSARARRLVYVSCDVATLARDARRLLDSGYALSGIEALDLFPNTAHVEALAVFDRQ